MTKRIFPLRACLLSLASYFSFIQKLRFTVFFCVKKGCRFFWLGIAFGCNPLLYATEPMTVIISHGEKEKDLLPIVNQWVISHYIQFPFLYAYQGEALPNHVFFEDQNAFVLFAEKEGKRVGLMMALPLDSYFLDVKYSPYPTLAEMEQKGFDPHKTLYVACFLVAKEERSDREIAIRLYQRTVDLAKKMGKTHICYFTTVREEDHLLKPSPYISVEPWDEVTNPFRYTGIMFDLIWPTLQSDGSVKDCTNPQALMIKEI